MNIRTSHFLVTFPAIIALATLVSVALSGCVQPCDNIPTERAPQVRLINAMPDEPTIAIYLGGRLADTSKIIDPSRLVDAAYPYDIPNNFGYRATYANGQPLQTSLKQKLVVLSAAGARLLDTTIALNDHRHTLLFFGLAGTTTRERLTPPRVMVLDDEADQPDPGVSLIRYIHVIPDLHSLDVYFRTTSIDGHPDLTINYGDSLGYKQLTNALGLTVTEGGNPNKIIFNIPYSFTGNGFFSTIILRGERSPLGQSPSISTDVISDVLPGHIIIPLESFYSRFCNAMRAQTLSLLVQGQPDWLNKSGPRSNVPGQNVLLNIPSDSVSDFAPFNPGYHGVAASWYFGTKPPPDTTWIKTYTYTSLRNRRYTVCAMNLDKLGSGPQVADSLILLDTMSSTEAGTGRVRFVNLSPDHKLSFTVAGHVVTLNQRDVVYLDLPSSPYSVDVSDGAMLKTINFTALSGLPSSVIFMSATSSDPLPYRVASE